jgi:hypothetical protein
VEVGGYQRLGGSVGWEHREIGNIVGAHDYVGIMVV